MSAAYKQDIIKQLIKLAGNAIEIRKSLVNPHVLITFQKCLQLCFKSENVTPLNSAKQDYVFQITSVIDYIHEELNTGHWSDIPIQTRQNFTIASFIKTNLLFQNLLEEEIPLEVLKTALKCVDMGLLLGAPLEENPELLANCAKCLRTIINAFTQQNDGQDKIKAIKRKFEDKLNTVEYQNLSAKIVDEAEVPSIESFQKRYFLTQIPVKLIGCMDHWPATTKWLDLNYLLNIAGDRTVPIEIGSHYTDEDWSQKLMTVKDFIKQHYLSESVNIGYLAQHNLFDQISELKEDIRIPDYCCCSLNYEESTDPDINAWFGPKGTVSPLHQDPKNNLLAQVYGTKQIILFSPNDTGYLYPHEDSMLSNTAQVDPLKPDKEKYPNFPSATMYKCLLGPGEMLFIPQKWWHHVTALDKSFSVSFWWQ